MLSTVETARAFGSAQPWDYLRLVCFGVWGAVAIQLVRLVTTHRHKIDLELCLITIGLAVMFAYVYETEVDRIGHPLGIGGRLLLGLIGGATFVAYLTIVIER